MVSMAKPLVSDGLWERFAVVTSIVQVKGAGDTRGEIRGRFVCFYNLRQGQEAARLFTMVSIAE
jgi:hypothetical protein